MTFCSRENVLAGGKSSRYFVSIFWTIFYRDESTFMISSYRQSFLVAVPVSKSKIVRPDSLRQFQSANIQGFPLVDNDIFVISMNRFTVKWYEKS